MKRDRARLAACAACGVAALLATGSLAAPEVADGGAPHQPATNASVEKSAQHAHDSEAAAAEAAKSAALAAATAQAAAAQAAQAMAGADPWADPRATRRGIGYASPWTLLEVGAALVFLAFFIGRFAPKKRRRVRRAAILFVMYATTFAVATGLHHLGSDAWSRRVWILADLFEVLTVINLVALAAFDLVLLALKIELANIAHDLALGGAYALATLGLLHRNGVNLSGLIATSAVVTVVLGLGLQATLGNVIGGIALQVDDSIHEGDWIQLPGGMQGRVKEIRWRHTVVETRNWDTLIVPNAKLLGDEIIILGKRADQPTQHRMWVYFNVDYRFSPEEVIRVVNDALLGTPIPNVANAPRPHCICFDFARENSASFGYYAVRYWLTDLAADDPTSSDVRLRIYTALKRADIPMAMPATAVFVSHDDPQTAERKQAKEMSNRVLAIERVDLFSGLSTDEKQQLCTAMRFAPFTRNEVITMQGASAHWLYVLVKGEVEVRVRSEGGAEKVVTRMRAPNVFGEMGVMTGEPRTASVCAMSEVECYRIDKDAFRRVVHNRPEIAEVVSLVMAQRRVELQSVREHLDAETRQKRVAVERNKILAGIQSFFGLDEDVERKR